MRPVRREEVLDLATYERMREDVRREVIAAKAPRCVHVGAHVTLLFENRRTVWYQVQEMLRAERITEAESIAHELATYNELLGGPGELGATLLIEIDDPAVRAVKLREWLGLPHHVYARLEDGTRDRPTFDPRQVGTERVSSVPCAENTGGVRSRQSRTCGGRGPPEGPWARQAMRAQRPRT